MKNKLLLIILIIAAFGIGFLSNTFFNTDTTQNTNTHQHEEKAEIWTCSMHPQIKLPEFGPCPICGMDLIPLSSMTSGSDDLADNQISLSEYAKKLAKLQVTEITTGNIKTEVNLSGKITWDEQKLKAISAYFGGRVEKLYVNYTGQQVKAGEPLALIYSPEFLSFQQEIKQAKKAQLQGDSTTIGLIRKKLKLLGLTNSQIERMENQQSIKDRVTINAPFQGVVIHRNIKLGDYIKTGEHLFDLANSKHLWVMLDAFESDLQFITLKQKVNFTTEAYPGVVFTGKVEFINPEINLYTRTSTIRVSVTNNKNLLKPGMLIEASLTTTKDSGLKTIYIPETAVLLTGKRAVAYVEVDSKNSTYEGRVLTLGPKVGNAYIVLSGLKSGEKVVTHGSFKIDAAMQIQAKPSMMYPKEVTPEKPIDIITLNLLSLSPAESKLATIWLGKIYTDYLNFSKASAQEDAPQAMKSASQIGSLLHSPPRVFNTSAKKAFLDFAGPISELAYSKDLEKLRLALADFSDLYIQLLKTVDFKPIKNASIFYCPMYRDNKGAYWIQEGETTSNPYYGDKMLRCGSLTEPLGGEK